MDLSMPAPNPFRRGTFLIALAAALALFLIMAQPRINDYSSNLQDPPQFASVSMLPANKDSDMRFPEKNKRVIEDFVKDELFILIPRSENRSASDVLSAGEQLMKEKEWEIIAIHPDQGIIEATVTTPALRFKDDFIMRVRTSQLSNDLRVDFRSKSRLGQSDFRANLKRIRQFRQDLLQKLKEQNQ